MMKRLAAVLLLGMATTLAFASPASAHGERSQEAFLRMRTIGWTDVVFDGGHRDANGDIVIAQGEKFTIKGVARLMNTWPDTLAKGLPRIGYINVATQGPCVEMLARTINGISTPGRIEITKGHTYSFDETMMGRRVGRWHVHPTFAVKGAGTLLRPGQWIRVTPPSFLSPVKIPHRAVEYEPPMTALDTAPTLAAVDARSAKYDYQAKVLRLEVDAKNVSTSPIELSQFVTSTLTFNNPAGGSASSGPYQDAMKLSSSGTIPPRQTTTLVFDLAGSHV